VQYQVEPKPALQSCHEQAVRLQQSENKTRLIAAAKKCCRNPTATAKYGASSPSYCAPSACKPPRVNLRNNTPSRRAGAAASQEKDCQHKCTSLDCTPVPYSSSSSTACPARPRSLIKHVRHKMQPPGKPQPNANHHTHPSLQPAGVGGVRGCPLRSQAVHLTHTTTQSQAKPAGRCRWRGGMPLAAKRVQRMTVARCNPQTLADCEVCCSIAMPGCAADSLASPRSMPFA
jgi:hypothetical protein